MWSGREVAKGKIHGLFGRDVNVSGSALSVFAAFSRYRHGSGWMTYPANRRYIADTDNTLEGDIVKGVSIVSAWCDEASCDPRVQMEGTIASRSTMLFPS